MKVKLFSAIIVLELMLGLIFIATTTSTADATGPEGLSIIPIDPDAAETLRAQGRTFKYPFPNSANHGKKFNPVGDLIPPWTTDSTQKILVLFVKFTDNPPGGPATRLNLQYFNDMLFGTTYDHPDYAPYPGHPTNRTLYNYYHEVSYGQVHIITLNMPTTLGWAQSGHAYNYYCTADEIHDNGFGPYPNNAQGLVIDAVKAVDTSVDFKPYADANNNVPNLFVVYAGTGAEWSADPGLLWSHSWSLSDSGDPDLTNGYLTNDGVYVNRYAMMPEVGGDLTGYTGSVYGPYPPTCGVYAHEYGHVLGLPDQYDYGYESQGTGMYSLMASGSWARYPYTTLDERRLFGGNSPTHLDAWSKYMLGFLDPTEINTLPNVITLVTLPPVETNPVAYKMDVPGSGGKEYFLFENRQNVGFDISLGRYGARGLAVYHVDMTVFWRNPDRANEAENWKEFRSEGWRKAWTGETHYAISLIQADDQWHLEHGTNVADGADLYPGSLEVHSLGSNTRPNTSNYYFWAGSEPKYGYSGVTVENIAEVGGDITADLSFVPWTPPNKK